MKDLIALRHKLHQEAELSGKEQRTNEIINHYISATSPDVHISKIGGYGVAALYKGKDSGPRLLIRADIDALPIGEGETCGHGSYHDGISHKCGHDGHATILCGLASLLSTHRPERGEVVLLFQPAEETGQGAKAVMADPLFADITPDYAIAIHNLPGFRKHQLVTRQGCFAAASFGLRLVFDGATAHASQPETGRNPSELLAILLHQLEKKRELLPQLQPFTTFTITHASLGEPSFGISPGHAEIWLTLRSYSDKNLELLTQQLIHLCQRKASDYLFDFSFSMHEAFPATTNDDRLVNLIESCGIELGMPCARLKEPFRWSEDFGRFSHSCPIALFGIGAGLEQPPLHDKDYDFPDDIIETSVTLLGLIVHKLLK